MEPLPGFLGNLCPLWWKTGQLCRVESAFQQCPQADVLQHEHNSRTYLPGHGGNTDGNRRVLPEQLSVLLSQHVPTKWW